MIAMAKYVDVVHDQRGHIMAFVVVDIPEGGPDLSIAPAPGGLVSRLPAGDVARITGSGVSEEELLSLIDSYRLDRHANQLVANES